MNVGDVLAELRKERDEIDAAIRSLERLVNTRSSSVDGKATHPSKHRQGSSRAAQGPSDSQE